jgi:hypothetical protein
MPALNTAFLASLKDDYTKYPNFIETGTFEGETIMAMEPLFANLYTIEIKPEFFANVKNKYKGNKIHFSLGDSATELGKIVQSVAGNSIFFLDGHWSGDSTGKGIKDCPLLEEINHIKTHHKGSAIIIIDDVRIFGKGPRSKTETCDWEDISAVKIIELIADRLTDHYYLPSIYDDKDRLVLHIFGLP